MNGVPSFWVNSAACIDVARNAITHKLAHGELVETAPWLREGPLTIGVTSGASTARCQSFKPCCRAAEPSLRVVGKAWQLIRGFLALAAPGAAHLMAHHLRNAQCSHQLCVTLHSSAQLTWTALGWPCECMEDARRAGEAQQAPLYTFRRGKAPVAWHPAVDPGALTLVCLRCSRIALLRMCWSVSSRLRTRHTRALRRWHWSKRPRPSARTTPRPSRPDPG